MKWLMKHRRISVCFIITFLPTVFSQVVYLHAHVNSSIVFPCRPPEHHQDMPFAFSLKREWIKNTEVLYHNFESVPSIKDPTFNDRISANTGINRSVNVSITDLRSYDTDIYVCMFHYETTTDFQNLSGREKFVLYVQDCYVEPCNCYSYTLLLFSVSAAAGLLFIIVFILTAVHCVKPSVEDQKKPQHSVPIYEEMNGVRGKASIQEDDLSIYFRPKKENPYSN